MNSISGSSPKKDHGQSPLQIAFKTGNFEITGYLIDHGVDINFIENADSDPGLRAPVLFDAINTVIMSFCYRDFNASDRVFTYVERLAREGADVSKTASSGWDAIDWTVTRVEQIIWKADRIHRVTGGSTKAMCKDSGCTDEEWGQIILPGPTKSNIRGLPAKPYTLMILLPGRRMISTVTGK